MSAKRFDSHRDAAQPPLFGVTITDSQNKVIKGGDAGTVTPLDVTLVTYALKHPFDGTSGRFSGKTRETPLAIEREIDGASPRLLQAFSDREKLSLKVELRQKVAKSGVEIVYFTLEAMDAIIVDYQWNNPANATTTDLAGDGILHPIERTTWVYSRLVIKDTQANTTATISSPTFQS